MKSESLCIPCFLKQAHSSVALATEDEEKRQEVLKAVSAMIPSLDMSRSPAYNSSVILHKVNELLGVKDPYASEKKRYNELSMSLLPALQEKVRNSADPLATAIRLSAVGNVIDLGIKHEVDIDGTIEKALGDGFVKFELEAFREKLSNTRRLLFITDNAGEIVFDRLVIEELKKLGKMTIAAVKSGPVINDATLEDAKAAGLDQICKVIETGSNFVGIEKELISRMMQQALGSADLVIAKGQGNYETLEGTSDRIFFVLKAKCDYVAQKLGVQKGDLVFCR